jgi:iron-sulfur cluster assembly protein
MEYPTTSQGEIVLEITHDAATLLTEIRKGQDVPDSFGLRVFPESTEPGEVTIGLGFTDEPVQGDQVTEQDGIRVFVAQELATPLEDTAIDITPSSNGASKLVFRPKDVDEATPADRN